MPHRDHVDESRFPRWELHSCDTKVTCTKCRMTLRINLEIFINSMDSTDLRPCPYCWGLSRIPEL